MQLRNNEYAPHGQDGRLLKHRRHKVPSPGRQGVGSRAGLRAQARVLVLEKVNGGTDGVHEGEYPQRLVQPHAYPTGGGAGGFPGHKKGGEGGDDHDW